MVAPACWPESCGSRNICKDHRRVALAYLKHTWVLVSHPCACFADEWDRTLLNGCFAHAGTRRVYRSVPLLCCWSIERQAKKFSCALHGIFFPGFGSLAVRGSAARDRLRGPRHPRNADGRDRPQLQLGGCEQTTQRRGAAQVISLGLECGQPPRPRYGNFGWGGREQETQRRDTAQMINTDLDALPTLGLTATGGIAHSECACSLVVLLLSKTTSAKLFLHVVTKYLLQPTGAVTISSTDLHISYA